MSRKVCVVTGTRAEFGLLRWLMHEIKSAPEFELQVLLTGSRSFDAITKRSLDITNTINHRFKLVWF